MRGRVKASGAVFSTKGAVSTVVDGGGAAAGPTSAAAAAKDTTIRVDTSRLDQVLNLSGEIGLTKNRLTHLRSNIMQGKSGPDTLRELDQSVSQLDMLVVNLQNAVMKTRMQPIDHIWSKLPRVVRDLGLQCGKTVRLEMEGKDTELDKTVIELIGDPLTAWAENAFGIQRDARGRLERIVCAP